MKERVGNWNRNGFELRKLGKILAAVVVGLSIGTLLPPDPVVLPVVGSVSGVLVGGIGLVVGGVLYAQLSGTSDCGCSGDCDCS